MIQPYFVKHETDLFLLPSLEVGRGECACCGEESGWSISVGFLLWHVGIIFGGGHAS